MADPALCAVRDTGRTKEMADAMVAKVTSHGITEAEMVNIYDTWAATFDEVGRKCKSNNKQYLSRQLYVLIPISRGST